MTPLQFSIDFDAVPALRAAGAVDKAFAAIGGSAEKASAQIGAGMSSASKAVESFQKRFDKAAGSLSTVAGGVAAAVGAVGGATVLFGKSVLDSGAELEKLETQLQTLMGSAEAGSARFRELFKIGASTPFEVGDLVQADATLRALGANAEEALPMVLDFAGAMNADLQSAALDVGRAMMFGAGAVETLAGRALRAQVELRTGQDSLKMSTEEFAKQVKTTLTDTNGIFAGGTAKLSKTWAGGISNLADEWTKFQKAVNDSGFFAGMKALLGETLAAFDANREAINGVATTIGNVLLESVQRFITLIGNVRDGWTRVQMAVNAIGGLFDVVVSKIAGMVRGIADAVVGIAYMQEAITGIHADAILETANAIAAKAAGIQAVANQSVAEAANEGARLRQELNDGAKWAKDINTSIDMAAQHARNVKIGDPQARGQQVAKSKPDEDAARKLKALQKELDAEVKAHADAAAEIGFDEETVRAMRFTREVNETAAQFDKLIAMRQAAGQEIVSTEAQKNETLANLSREYMAEEAKIEAEALEDAIEKRRALEQKAAADRLRILEEEAATRARIMSSMYDFATSAASSTANQLVQVEGKKSDAIKAISAGLFADLLDQLAKYFGVKAAAAAATGNFVAAGLFAAGGVVAAAGAGVVRGLAAKSSGGDTGEVFHQGGVDLMPGDRVQTGETVGVINRGATRDMGLDEVSLRNANHRGMSNAGGSGVFRLRIGNADVAIVEELSRIDTRSNGGFHRRMRGQQASGDLAPGFRGRL